MLFQVFIDQNEILWEKYVHVFLIETKMNFYMQCVKNQFINGL